MFLLKGIRFRIDRFFLSLWPRPAAQIYKKKKVGVLRLDGIGDLILFLDALKGYRSFYPRDEYEIFLIVEHWASSVLKENTNHDRIFPLDTRRFKKNLFYRWRVLKEIRSLRFDIFINGCIFRELLYGDILSLASEAKERYGFSPQPDQTGEKVYGDTCYTKLISDPKWRVHELERNAELVRSVGYSEFEISIPKMEISGRPGKENYFIIAPGAKFEGRRWPFKNFIDLTRKILSQFDFTPVVTGGKEDRLWIQEMMASAPDIPWIHQVGTLSISELSVLISKAQFIICNDSGPMHLAISLGTKTIAIASGAEFQAYPGYPQRLRERFIIVHDLKTDCFNCRWNCPYNRNPNEIKPCLGNISVDQVFSQSLQFLKC